MARSLGAASMPKSDECDPAWQDWDGLGAWQASDTLQDATVQSLKPAKYISMTNKSYLVTWIAL